VTRKGQGGASPGFCEPKGPVVGPCLRPAVNCVGGGVPPYGEPIPVLWGREQSRSENSRCAPKQPPGDPGREVWEPLPPRMVSARPARPGLLPGAEGRASSGSGNHPGGGRGPLGMPVDPGLVAAPEQRPRSRVSAPRP